MRLQSDHRLPSSLTHLSLADWIVVTLLCEDANSKLDVVFTVANVDIGKYVDETLVQNWKLKFSQKTECLFRL